MTGDTFIYFVSVLLSTHIDGFSVSHMQDLFLLVLLFAHVERFSVSGMQDFNIRVREI